MTEIQHLDILKAATYRIIDNLKAVSTNHGLGNSGNEYKIITQAFLYKFLNDKFFYHLKQVDELPEYVPGVDVSDTAAVEKGLTSLDTEEYEDLLDALPPYVARLHPHQFLSYLYGKRNQENFHGIFDDALLQIAEDNKAVFGVTTGEGNRVRLFEPISNYIVDPEKRDAFASAVVNTLVGTSFEPIFSQKYDFFADIFEYLIGDYNKDSGKYAEYYTPHTIAQIIANILVSDGDQNVTAYDPAAGSGMLILTLADKIGEKNVTVYTQDISQKSNEILRLNLIMNNLVASLPHVIQADTLVNPRHVTPDGKRIRQFDYIVSNPPFNTDFSETRDTLAGENYKKRFFAGVPNIPKKKKDSMAIYLMFLQHIIVSMKPQTGRAAIVVPTGFLTAGSIAQKIRKHIIDSNEGKGILRAVVSMPSNIFANTGTNVSILFLDNGGPQDGKVLLVDASNLGTKEKKEGTKNQRTYLSQEECQRIVDTVNQREEQDDFSVLVDIQDIAAKKYSFSAGQYFKVKIEYVDLTPEEFSQKMQDYETKLQTLFDEGHQLEQEIFKGLGELKYEKM